jgi:tetratricopeptide (TPR) repeat protein
MKKNVVLAVIISFASFNGFAQDALKEIECKGYVDAVSKALKETENPKKNIKSATWLKLGSGYQDLALRCTSDSSAAQKAFDAFTRASDVEKAAGGKKMKDIDAALKSPTLASAFLQQGAGYYNSKNTKMAAKFFNMSSNLNPKDTTAALYAGIANQSLGDNDGAINVFKRYLENGGKDLAVYFSMSQIYKIGKKFDDAIAILKKGSAVHPADKDLKNEMVNIYIASNNLDGAIADLEKMEPNAANLANLGYLIDSKTQELLSDLNKTKEKVSKSNTSDLEKKLTSEKDKLSAFEGELNNLNNKLKKEPKTAAATKKRIGEVAAQKDAIQSTITSMTSELASKKASSGNDEALMKSIASKEAVFKASLEKTMGIYTKVLALDPNVYDVNFNMAVMYFNQAVETKRAVDAMDMKEFQKSGKEIEKTACAQFAKSKPYFDKCNSLKANDEVVAENLKNLVRILEQCK